MKKAFSKSPNWVAMYKNEHNKLKKRIRRVFSEIRDEYKFYKIRKLFEQIYEFKRPLLKSSQIEEYSKYYE